MVERGLVKNGAIVFAQPLSLPEGTEVTVQIEPVVQEPEAAGAAEADPGAEALPFFGMWADREDLRDSVAWVERERARWQDRLSRRG